MPAQYFSQAKASYRADELFQKFLGPGETDSIRLSGGVIVQISGLHPQDLLDSSRFFVECSTRDPKGRDANWAPATLAPDMTDRSTLASRRLNAISRHYVEPGAAWYRVILMPTVKNNTKELFFDEVAVSIRSGGV